MTCPTPGDPDVCNPKCRCGSGPCANISFLCDDPCAGQGDGCTFTCENGCVCGECYGSQVTTTDCLGVVTCFRSGSIKCEEELGGCPSVVQVIESYRTCDEFSGPMTAAVLFQYPDGSFAQVGSSGANVRYANIDVVPLLGVECGSGPC